MTSKKKAAAAGTVCDDFCLHLSCHKSSYRSDLFGLDAAISISQYYIFAIMINA